MSNHSPYSDYQVNQPWLPFSEVLLDWDESFHQLMLNDRLRMQAYEQAIKETVKPGDVVVDLGAGTGILSQWALEAGASKVYAIELDASILNIAEQSLAKTQFADRFIAINKLSYDVTLPERVDVLISEILGNIADNEDFQPIISDAIARFLKPEGKCLPKDACSYIAPVTSESAHEAIRQGAIKTLNPSYKLEKLMAQKAINNRFNLYYDTVLLASSRLSKPQALQRYDGDWSQSSSYHKSRSFVVEKDAVLTGFQCYFVATLSDNVSLDISGDCLTERSCSDSWKHAYLPIEHRIEVQKGDIISLSFSRYYPKDKCTLAFRQFYRWKGTVMREGNAVASFDQCMDEGVFNPAR
ncbi:50S ribosomal protein L11 methyltransferase [Litoribrevibacter euphylliae]|uniref:50S ribosomal protein L11 methyltransferase n=1 Tax=Litoribrevibacter euphylliae TaxID=1834034 RepID=A0ABV7HE75_9GAMM